MGWRTVWLLCALALGCDDQGGGEAVDAGTSRDARQAPPDGAPPRDAAPPEPDVEPPPDMAAADAEPTPDAEADAAPDAGAPADMGPECVADDACAVDDPCTASRCEDGACVHAPVPGCCVEDADCEGGVCLARLMACAVAAEPGAVVITELLVDPDAVSDARGEWVEIHNASEAEVVLEGWALAGEDEEGVLEFAEPLTLAPGDYALLARSGDPALNGGLEVDATYAGVSLRNEADRVALLDALGNEVDAVAYGPGFPQARGVAMSLSADRLDAEANDAAGAWCPAEAPWAEGDLGTPGAPNPLCPEDPCDPDPCLDAEADACADAFTRVRRVLPGRCVVADGAATCVFDEESNDCAAIDQICVDAACVPGERRPVPGEVVFTEVLADPDGSLEDEDAEWFELRNTTAETLRLDGCVVADPTGGEVVFRLVLEAGGHALFVRDADPERNGGLEGDATFDFALNNGGDVLTLTCGEVEVDRLEYGELPRGRQVATQRGEAGWCLADAIYFGADDDAHRGTPGLPNPDCPPDPCAGNPCLVAPPPNCVDGEVLERVEPGACEVIAGAAQCVFDERRTACGAGRICVEGGCVLPDVEPGAAVFSEILYDPHDALGEQAEWFELRNPGEAPIDLRGCRLFDASGADNGLQVAVQIPAGGHALFARSADPEVNGGLEPDQVFDFALNNNGVETLTLRCGDTVVDAVSYDVGGEFPRARRASISLDPRAEDNRGANWCRVRSVYFDDPEAPHRGTPGAANPPCDVPVDACRLRAPEDVEAEPGAAVAAEGEVRLAGVTEPPGNADDPLLRGQVGVGPPGSAPGEGWIWAEGEPDPAWEGPDADRYRAELRAPDAGAVDVAWRFSADDGRTWTLCDLDGGDYDTPGRVRVGGAPGRCEPNPCAEPPPPACDEDGVTRVVFLAPGRCAELGGAVACGFDEARERCPGVCREGACVAPSPGPGDVIIAEIMYDPHEPLSDFDAEWLELHNRTDTVLSLDGCQLGPLGDRDLLDGLTMAPDARRVLARAEDPRVNGGLAVDGRLGFPLGNNGTPIDLICDEVLIDAVDYGLEGFPSLRRSALSLDPEADAEANDAADAWCAAEDLYFGEGEGAHFGTPGAPNPPCPRPVAFCRLQFPLDVEVETGTPVSFFGRVFQAGVTDLSAGNDPAPLLRAQLAWGPVGTPPAEWRTVEAEPNPGWDGADEPNNDEYQAELLAPAPGEYAVAFRFSVDGGRSWTLCDGGDPGSTDGFEVADAGALTVRAQVAACEPDPCAPPPDGCAGRTALREYQPGVCRVIEGRPTCEWPVDEVDCGALACYRGDCVELGRPPRAPGELLITEIMYDPRPPLAEAAAEWIELLNTTGDTLDLTGCTLEDRDRGVAIEELHLPAGERVVFASTTDRLLNGGVDARQAFTFSLDNRGDRVAVRCGGDGVAAFVVDEVVVDESFAAETGRSVALDPEARDPRQNDAGAWWCLGVEPYGPGHQGTPGGPNPPCPDVDVDVDFCRLQFPLDVEVQVGAVLDVFGRVFEAGVTDRSLFTDFEPRLRAEAGYGPVATDPRVDAGWTWVQGAGNAEYEGAEPNNDEYVAALLLQTAGAYAYAWRFSLDAGFTWLYCDAGDAGSSDGFDLDALGRIAVTEDPCVPTPCGPNPPPVCRGDTLVGFDEGRCEVVEDDAVCVREELPEDCAAREQVCREGACVDP